MHKPPISRRTMLAAALLLTLAAGLVAPVLAQGNEPNPSLRPFVPPVPKQLGRLGQTIDVAYIVGAPLQSGQCGCQCFRCMTACRQSFAA